MRRSAGPVKTQGSKLNDIKRFYLMLMNLDSSTNGKAPDDRRCYIACKPDIGYTTGGLFNPGMLMAFWWNKKETY